MKWNIDRMHIAPTHKATRALMICQHPAGKTRGCNQNILRWLYISIVRSTVTYGAITWLQKITQVTTRNTLDKLQGLACVCITEAMRTCPTAALEVILDLTPLHIVVEAMAYAAMHKLTRAGAEGNEIAFQRAWSSRAEHSPLLSLPSNEKLKKYSFKKNFLTKLSNKKECNGESSTYFLKENSIKWYTDGSKIDSGTGAGVFGP
ncbi:hypothetical protein Trydic_g20396 [Trypoxylus dichotomus]